MKQTANDKGIIVLRVSEKKMYCLHLLFLHKMHVNKKMILNFECVYKFLIIYIRKNTG